MASVFEKIDKVKPVYDMVYRGVMFLCKVLLVVDIGITCMSYMAVLSAALAIRRGAHIRMTALDSYMPKAVVKFLDILADVSVLILAVIMITVGWRYASGIGAKGSYVSMPGLSRFWMYFPVPLAGVAMVVFELEALYSHVKDIFVKEEK